MQRTLAVFTALTLALAAMFTLTPVQAEDDAANAAPAFTLKDHTGKEVSLSDFKDKIVVLEWISFKCPFVVRHHNEKFNTMVTLANEYKSKDVVWLAIDSSHFATIESNASDVEANNLPYPILDDNSGEVAKAYGAKTTPDMRIIKNGKVLYAGAIDNDPRGNMSDDERINYVRQALDQIIADEAVSVPQTKPYGCTIKFKG